MEAKNAAEGLKEEFLITLGETGNYLTGLGSGRQDVTNPDIINKYGLVTYLNVTTNQPPPTLIKRQERVSPLIEGLIGIVVSAVLKIAGNDTPRMLYPALWNEIFEKAIAPPFFNSYSYSKEQYQKEIPGAQVAANLISFLTDTAVENSSEWPGFQKFFATQGELIRIQAGGDGDGYQYAVVSIVHEIFNKGDDNWGDDWVYIPKVKMYFTSFTSENFNIVSSCRSSELVKMNFELNCITAAFKIDNWYMEKDFRDNLDAFLDKYGEANISESQNYFNKI